MKTKKYFSPAFIKQVTIKMKSNSSEKKHTQSRIIYRKRSYQEIRDAFIRASKMLELNDQQEYVKP